ncbi:MAG: hypothetical protein ACJAUD_000299 [Crocinitomicaceae bacterium]|jgi:hypothetical protein
MSLTKYLLIAELDDVGYVLEYIDDLESAKKRLEEYWELINYTIEPLNELFRYNIENVNEYRGDCIYGRTNGLNSVYLIQRNRL